MQTLYNLSEVYLECNPDPLLIINAEGFTQYANPSFIKLTGISLVAVTDKFIDKLDIADKYKTFFWESRSKMKGGETCRQQFMQKNKSRGFSYYDVRLTAIEDPDHPGRITCFIASVNDITTVIDKTQQMKFMESELHKAIDTLKQLLYKSSHDLRAPISTINGLVEIAKADTKDEQILTYLNMILSSSNKMDSVLSDVRRIYTMYLGHFEAEKIDFYALVNHSLQKFGDRFPLKENLVKTDICLQRDHFLCKYLLEKVFTNLLDNALRYRLSDGGEQHQVLISITDSEDTLQIKISDNGRGINKDIKNKVFDMFFKGECGSKHNGMGLFIAKTAVEKLNGKIEVHSRPGKGTSVTVIIPE